MSWIGKCTFLLVSAASLMLHASASAQEQREPDRTITVSGEGIVRIQPDMAIVRFGIVTRAADAEEARRLNAEAAREAMNAVRQLGIEERFIKLENLRIQPIQEFDPDTRRYVEQGIEAVRDIVVEVHDLEQLPTLVAEIIQKGANRLHGVMYDLENRDQPRNEALQQAVLNAREKAQLLATTLGVQLGPVLRINEQSFDFPRPFMELAMDRAVMSKEAAAPEPEAYAPGEIEVRATVQTVYGIE